MDESRRFGRSGPPAVEAPCFHGTRCPPVLHAGRSAGRGYAAGHPRPPYDPSATAAQIALRALPPRLGHARAARGSLIGRSAAEGERRPGRAGLAGVPARHALQRVQHRVHADLARVLLAVHVVQEKLRRTSPTGCPRATPTARSCTTRARCPAASPCPANTPARGRRALALHVRGVPHMHVLAIATRIDAARGGGR